MGRSVRNTAILAKLETVEGTDALPTGAANAMLVSDFTPISFDSKNIDRKLVRGYFGAGEQLVGSASLKLSFTVEMAGSGTAGTAPAFDPLLQSCGMASAALTSPARVEYTPISSAIKSLTGYYYDDGTCHKMLGSRGTFSLSAKAGEIPSFKFDFTGLDGGIATGTTTGTYSAFKTPVPMTKANVIDITVGATYALGAITGGTVYPSTGLDVDIGNTVTFTPMLSGESVDITDREAKGSFTLDLTAAQEVALMAIVKANTTQSVALTIGTVSGNKWIIFVPCAQFINPKKAELNGKRLISFDFRALPTPTGTGNDEIRLVHV
jgi:hypothetical protein